MQKHGHKLLFLVMHTRKGYKTRMSRQEESPRNPELLLQVIPCLFRIYSRSKLKRGLNKWLRAAYYYLRRNPKEKGSSTERECPCEFTDLAVCTEAPEKESGFIGKLGTRA